MTDFDIELFNAVAMFFGTMWALYKEGVFKSSEE